MRLMVLIDEKEDVEAAIRFLTHAGNLRVDVDTEKREILFSDEGQTVSFFMRAPLVEDDEGDLVPYVRVDGEMARTVGDALSAAIEAGDRRGDARDETKYRMALEHIRPMLYPRIGQ